MDEIDDFEEYTPKKKPSKVGVKIGTPEIVTKAQEPDDFQEYTPGKTEEPKPAKPPESNWFGTPKQAARSLGSQTLNALALGTMPQALAAGSALEELKNQVTPEYPANANPEEGDLTYLAKRLGTKVQRNVGALGKAALHPQEVLELVKRKLAEEVPTNRKELERIRKEAVLPGVAGQIIGMAPSLLVGGPTTAGKMALQGVAQGFGGNETLSQGDLSAKGLAKTGAGAALGGVLGAGSVLAPGTTGALLGTGSAIGGLTGAIDPKDAAVGTALGALGGVGGLLKFLQDRRLAGNKALEQQLVNEDRAVADTLNKAISEKAFNESKRALNKVEELGPEKLDVLSPEERSVLIKKADAEVEARRALDLDPGAEFREPITPVLNKNTVATPGRNVGEKTQVDPALEKTLISLNKMVEDSKPPPPVATPALPKNTVASPHRSLNKKPQSSEFEPLPDEGLVFENWPKGEDPLANQAYRDYLARKLPEDNPFKPGYMSRNVTDNPAFEQAYDTGRFPERLQTLEKELPGFVDMVKEGLLDKKQGAVASVLQALMDKRRASNLNPLVPEEVVTAGTKVTPALERLPKTLPQDETEADRLKRLLKDMYTKR